MFNPFIIIAAALAIAGTLLGCLYCAAALTTYLGVQLARQWCSCCDTCSAT